MFRKSHPPYLIKMTMRIDVQRVFLVCTIIALAAGCLAAKPSTAGSNSGPISVQMSLATGDTFSLGEPVVLHYKISNSSDQDLLAYMGVDEKAWLSEQLTDGSGKGVPPALDPVLPQVGGLHSIGPRVQPHQYQQGEIVISQRFVIPHPGDYTLSVHVELPYGATGQDWSKFHTGYTQDFTFPLTVTPADPARLKATAGAYRQKAANDRDSQWHPWYVDALFFMPEAEALPSWKGLASEPAIGVAARSQIVSDLLRVHSKAAADIMADMIWRPAQSPNVVASAPARRLAHMFLTGDTMLKQHIKQIYSAHGMTLPDTPLVGSAQD